jgi:hypothetical protein
MRNMSFALTTKQVRAQTKTVTRRLGWTFAKVGDLVQPVLKCQGLKPGEGVTKIGGPVRIVDVWRGPLNGLLGDDFASSDEAKLEGFPHLTSEEFVAMFCKHMRCTPEREVTRLEFEYVPEAVTPTPEQEI